MRKFIVYVIHRNIESMSVSVPMSHKRCPSMQRDSSGTRQPVWIPGRNSHKPRTSVLYGVAQPEAQALTLCCGRWTKESSTHT